MDIIYLQDARLLEWACQKLMMKFSPEQCRWVAGLVGGSIAWVAVFSHFSSRNCQLTLVTDGSKRWASRATFRTLARIVFKDWGLARLTMIVSADNVAALKMHRKSGRFAIGGKEEGRMRDLFADGVDGIVFGLLKKECRWT